MRNAERCGRCNKFTMVGIDNGSAILFAHQFCKCSKERDDAMSDNTRDTQFQGFADKVCRDLADKGVLKWNEVWDDAMQVIARRAYDLVCHTLEYAKPIAFDRLSIGEHVERIIPDMMELPKESS